MAYVDFLSKAQPNPALLGGKGSNLVRLIKFGINVPPGFIINTNSYKKFIDTSHLKEEIFQTLSVDYKPKEILQISSKIKDLFLNSKIPLEIINEINKAHDVFNKDLNKESSFSVRSSANIEDSTKFSFAGQAESFLNIKTLEEILISVRNCWISLFSPQSLLYFLHMKKNDIKLSLKDLEMAVVIQKMINSQISGVLFTANVLNNDVTQMLINSTWGLGESIADNLIIPDLIILNKENFKILKYTIGDKEKKSILNPKGISTILIENEQEFRNKCSLSKFHLTRLYDLGIQIENEFNYPQDIEWAIENDVLYTLQSRPITTLRGMS